MVLLLAAGAILGGVVVVAMGRGGELVPFRRDVPAAVTRFRSPLDIVSVRLPLAPFGYQAQATGDALTAAARLVAERDAEIVLLRRELHGLGVDADADLDPAVRDEVAGTAGQDSRDESEPAGDATTQAGLAAHPQQRP